MTEPGQNGAVFLRSIRVEGLFGLYTHHIELNREDRVTVIHGPNGVGKTVLLKMVAAVFSDDWSVIVNTPFRSFGVGLSDGQTFTMEPFIQTSGSHGKLATATLRSAGSELAVRIRALGNGGYMGFDQAESDALNAFRSSVVGLHFIETQRLLRPRVDPPSSPWEESEPAFTLTITEYADDLQSRLTETLAQYASESQALERSFPQRLLKASAADVPVSQLAAELQALEQQRARLVKLGLLDDDGQAAPLDLSAERPLDPTERKVMVIYLADAAHKFGVLEDLARRVEILTGHVNATFQHKTLRIDRESGFSMIGHDGATLPLTVLSSGEQHELVLLYDLLFRVPRNTLVLIDEPELSLHVTWQKRFLPDLLEIVKVVGLDVVVATHSPFIAGARTDLMVPLSTEITPSPVQG